MAIFLTERSKVIVQGMTGSEGRKHTQRMLAAGTNIVGGVTPGKGGQSVEFAGGRRVPVFASVAEAVDATGADVTVIFVPAKFTKGAVYEAVDAAVPLAVVITEGVPVHDTANFFRYATDAGTTRLIGPKCPGIISPAEKCKVGIMPGHIHQGGQVGVVSRSGTLTYEAGHQLTSLGIGQSAWRSRHNLD